MNDEITPLETGLKFAVKMAKNDFIGKSALEEKGTPSIKRIGLKVTGRGIIREHQDVYAGDRKIVHTTSGTHCPYLGYPIAMALVDADSVEIGDTVEADVRGRRVAAEVVALPFYKREKIKRYNKKDIKENNIMILKERIKIFKITRMDSIRRRYSSCRTDRLCTVRTW